MDTNSEPDPIISWKPFLSVSEFRMFRSEYSDLHKTVISMLTYYSFYSRLLFNVTL